MRLLPLALLVGLAGCASQRADRAAAALTGGSYADAVACMGVPRTVQIAGGMVAEWDVADATGAGASLPIADLLLGPLALLPSVAGSVSLSGAGSCHVIAHVVAGRVMALRYSGESGGISGPNAKCAPLLRACGDGK